MMALALVVLSILGGLTILERRRMAPVLWAGVAFTAPLQGIRTGPVLALSDLLLIAAFAMILPDVLVGWRRVVPAGVVIAFIVLVTAGLAGTFFAADVGASLANLVRIVLAAAGSVTAMALWDPGRARLQQFAWLWFAGACTSAAWAAVTPRSFVGRAVGLSNHPNHFGLMCMLAVGLGVGLALSSTGWPRMAALGGVVLLLAGVGLSGSRAALLGTAVAIGLVALLTRRFRLLAASGVVVVLAAMAVVVGIVHIPDSNALARLGGGGGSAGSDVGRVQVAEEALTTIARYPLTGQGFQFAAEAHNIYLQALVVGGPLALLSFLCLSGLILRAAGRAVRRERHRRSGPLVAGLMAGYAAYLSTGFLWNILWDRYLWTYVALLLVLAATSEASALEPAELRGPGGERASSRAPGIKL